MLERRIDPVAVGKAISFYREKNCLSQKDLALKIDIKPNSLSYYEHGRSMPSVETIVRIAYVLGISANDLLYSDNNNVIEKTDIPQIRGQLLNLLMTFYDAGAANIDFNDDGSVSFRFKKEDTISSFLRGYKAFKDNMKYSTTNQDGKNDDINSMFAKYIKELVENRNKF